MMAIRKGTARVAVLGVNWRVRCTRRQSIHRRHDQGYQQGYSHCRIHGRLV